MITIAEMIAKAPICGSSMATIWPVSRPNLLAERPEYSDRHKMPRPSPNGMMTAVIELRCRARLPSRPMSSAASSDPVRAPGITPIPNSRPAEPPANESSLMPCTAKGMSRATTNTPMRPPTTPRIAPAKIELCSSTTSSP